MFKSIKSKIIDIIAPFLKPIIEAVLKIYVFEPLYEKDVKLHNLVVTELYPPVDVYLEEAAKKTESDVDDYAVEAVKVTLEERAKIAGIELPNLDED